MNPAKRKSLERPRELRRRVMMPARLKSSSGWTDACILNISSHGLLILSAQPGAEGSRVELRRGVHVIVGRVVWQDGSSMGLQAEDRLPVEDILSLNASSPLSQTASHDASPDATKWERRREERRSQGRMMEFAGVVVIACSLAVTAFDTVGHALARPMAMVSQALGH